MQRIAIFILGAILIAGCAKGPEESDQKPYSPPPPSGKTKNVPAPPVTSDADAGKKLREQFKAFAIRKRDYAKRMVVEQNIKPPPLIWEFYQSAIDGDFAETQKKFAELGKQYGRGENEADVSSEVQHTFPPAMEVVGAMEMVDGWHAKFLHFYITEIVSTIPDGSKYLGGTDPGRFAITLGSKSHEKADPFFTITQTALADGSYLQYLRQLYGNKIYISTEEDRGRAFSNWYSEAKAKEGQSQDIPAIMDINGRLAKVIFNKNPDHDFYLEESLALDWMKPHMVPHGLLFKLDRKPLKELPPDLIDQNRKDWQKYMALCVGDAVVKPETTVAELCQWVEVIYIKGNRDNFKGDALFLKGKKEVQGSPTSSKGLSSEQKAFSKMRCDQARLFTWRESTTQDAELKKEYAKEADYAYRQAFALGPINPQVVLEFSSFLTRAKRFEGAKMVLNTFAKTEVVDSNSFKQFYRNVFLQVLFQEEAHWVSQKEYAKAIVTVQKMVEIDGENKAQHFQRIERYKKLQ